MFWLLVLVGVGLTNADDSSGGSYLITSSRYLQPGMPFNVSIDILNTTDTVHIQAEVQRVWNNYTNIYRIPIMMAKGDFTKGTTGTLSMNIPSHVENGRYRLHVRGSGALQFEREQSVYLRSKSISVMIQTDKAMYKPGQMVHFRAFGVYPNLQVYTGAFDITLLDPSRNILKEWTALHDASGVVAGEFQLADQTVLGDWTIKVQPRDEVIMTSKSFTVAEYQLPRFEVKVDLPSFALTSDKMLSGTVTAKYTFGTPVKGMVELHTQMQTGSDYCGRPPKYVELAFPIDGEAKFEIPMADIMRLQRYLDGYSVAVVAIVKEGLTGVKLNGSNTVKYHQYPYKIEVLNSSPKTFSPKLPYTAYIKVSQQDGRPVSDLSSPVGVYTCVTYRIVQDDQSEYSCSSFTGNYGLPPTNYTIPASGIIPVDMRIPENATSIDVKVHYKEISDTLSVKQKDSLSSNYMQLRLTNKGLKAGQAATFTIELTEDVPFITYEVLSRGTVDITDQVSVGGQNPVQFNVPVSATMAPEAHIIAYYVRKSGEVVADGLSFSVDDIFDNKVSIDFSRNESKPHENIDVLVSADPLSSVNLLAVDQSVLLLKSGNDITTDQVLDELKTYSSGQTDGEFSPEVFAISSSSTQASNVFSDAGLLVITDARYYDYNYYASNKGPIGYTPMPGATPYAPLAGMGHSSGLKEVKRVRKNFPETWLWVNKTVGADGKATISTTVPDTITSWIASAFAVNSATGLGVAPSTTKLRVFSPFFVSLSMPTSVLRGEQVVIQASIFNYLPSDVDVVVSLPTSTDYTNVVVDSTGKTRQESKDQTHYITVKSNEPQTVYFPIIPSSLGAIDIEVSARTTLAADAVRRQLNVQVEGIPKEYNTPVFIELTPGGADFNQQVALSLPPETVTGSEKVRVKVTGDLIGASLDNLENLLALPTGCGEQNMMNFAPDVYVADYLYATNQITPALESRIMSYLELGYQRELAYQRYDGSFSPFGDRDEAGHMWLTAFVARTFHQARPYIFVGNQTLGNALNWMASRQNLDGSFNEPGLVFDRQMKSSKASLTAMALLAFLENQDISGFGINEYTLGNATVNATNYLESMAPSITDPFTLAIVSYALSEAGSSVADVTFNKLNAAADVKGTLKHWTEPTTASSNYYTKWTPPHTQAQPIDIQTTAYALLASSSRGDLKGGLPITNWLTSQRNPYGGFSSTQDTMVALHALTDYARRAHTSGFQVEVDIKSGSDSQHISVTDNNALVLQSRELTTFPKQVSLTATGKGVAYAEVDVFFNVEAEIGKPSFDISTVLLDDTINNFRLMTCTKWLKKGSSGMTVMEISIPSGFDPDMTSIGNVAGLKRVERRGRNVVVYFDEIGTTSICFDILSTRTGMVTNNQPSYVTVYDYYQPSNQGATFYETRSLKKATICDVCRKCCPQA
ncbi:CD109 antigen-like isoform X2 [Haliotis rubra]|uniref:CD109 antigen-like isoform X1 n=1 Tax=Haliotis rubra TaxID=36100 RepID=UPI001EE5970D|nr:CD109 antigen-like isoform X1 [Haliotis rubra]XP_046569085.1 CD109 antigen-like isoform X2 [Haliotis rubra]